MASQPVVRDAQHADQHSHEHPSQKKYVQIAAILAIITAVEVLVYYVESIESLLVPTLIVLSAVKFVMVVGYFMHLKFDSKMLTWMFTFGMIISVAVFIGLWLMQHHDKITQFTGDMSI
jgi:cytochrome c oxidase subunit IV